MTDDLSRRGSDEKILQVHTQMAVLIDNVTSIKETMERVPLNAQEILFLKDRLTRLEGEVSGIKEEQKIIEMTHAFFKVFKYIAGFVVVVGAAWAVIHGAAK